MGIPVHKVLVVHADADSALPLQQELRRMNISSDVAVDGWQALQRIHEEPYLVVVTDLVMPVLHGYALIRYLLTVPWRPAIVVCTSIAEPRLVRHLFELGVEEVLVRPIPAHLVSSKIQQLIQRSAHEKRAVLMEKRVRSWQRVRERWHGKLVDDRLGEWWRQGLEHDDGSLSVWGEVCRDERLRRLITSFANNTFFNTKAQWTDDPMAAVRRMGTARAAELLLASSVLCRLLSQVPSWLNAHRLAWQGWAATMLADLFTRAGGPAQRISGLLTVAMLAEAGRILLAHAFESQYPELLALSQEARLPLEIVEERELGITAPAVVGRLLEQSSVQLQGGSLFSWVSWPWQELDVVPSSYRLPIEWLKAARCLGKISVFDWNDWDIVEPPPPRVVASLNLPSVDLLVRTIQKCAVQWRWDEWETGPAAPHISTVTLAPRRPSKSVAYCGLINRATDVIPALLHSLGWKVEHCGVDRVADHPAVLTYIPMHIEQADTVLPGCEAHTGKFAFFSAKHTWATTVSPPFSAGALTTWLDHASHDERSSDVSAAVTRG